MEIQDPNPVVVDNSDLGPHFLYDENYRTIREEMLTISRVVGGAILGGLADVAKDGFDKAKSFTRENITDRFSDEPIRRSKYLRNKKRFVANPDLVGADDVDIDFESTDLATPLIASNGERIN